MAGREAPPAMAAASRVSRGPVALGGSGLTNQAAKPPTQLSRKTYICKKIISISHIVTPAKLDGVKSGKDWIQNMHFEGRGRAQKTIRVRRSL